MAEEMRRKGKILMLRRCALGQDLPYKLYALIEVLTEKEKPAITFFPPERSFYIMQRSKLKFGQSKLLVISLSEIIITILHNMKLQCRNGAL